MELTRRDFVKLLGLAAGGLAVGGGAATLMKIPKSLEPVLYSGPRIESWKLTTCSKCPGGCSLRVRLIDNFPIQAFGNLLSPINEGGICSMGLTSVSDLYHPSRITSPLKKVNGKFIPISYEEAYNILSENLGKVIKEKGQDNIFIVAQTESEIRVDLLKRFARGAGIKNLIIDNYLSNSESPYKNTASETPDFIDFEKCDYILNFGAQLSENSISPLYFSRTLIDFRERGNKITTAGSKLTGGIFKSDEWIPIRPAALGDLALGAAWVLLKDEAYDKDAEKSVTGFSSIKNYILENYTPENVEKLTGVSKDVILETGRAFERAKAPAAYFDESILHNSNGTQSALSIIFLNTLKGFAGYGKIKDSFYASVISGSKERAEYATFSTFKNSIAVNSSVKILMVAGSNFVFNNTDQEKLKKQMESIPFIVSFSPFIDETSTFARLIIPDHNDLEKLDFKFNEITGKSVVTVQQPVVDPLFKTTDTGDVFISLMKDLKTSPEIPYASVSDYAKAIAKKIFDNRNGSLMSQIQFTEIEKGLRKIGWQADQYGSFDEFWDSLLELGGWWDPFGEKDNYAPKINFGNKLPYPITSNNNTVKTISHDKLYLNIFRKTLDYKGSMSIYPVLVEQFGHNRSVFYQLWVEINPDTARRHSLTDRSRIKIKTPEGKFPAVVIYNPAVMPGNLDVPFGLGHDVLGDKSGINPLVFSENIFDQESGEPSFSETPAEIEA